MNVRGWIPLFFWGGAHFNILFHSYLLKKDISLDSFFHEKKNKNTDEIAAISQKKNV